MPEGLSPILVTGIPRSGTTFVGRVLGRAPEVCYIHEPLVNHCRAGFFRLEQARHYSCQDDLNTPLTVQKLEQLIQLRFDLRADWREHRRLEDRLKALGWWGAAAWFRWRHTRPLIKDPFALLAVDWLQQRFGFQPVVMVRHPAAVVYSCLRKGWSCDLNALVANPLVCRVAEIPKDNLAQLGLVEQFALMWKLMYGAVLYERQRHPGWFFLRHTDLIADPIGHLQRMHQYLDLPFRPSTEKFILDLTSAQNPSHVPDDSMSIRRNSRSLNHPWREALSDADKETIRRITEPVAKEFYSKDDWN